MNSSFFVDLWGFEVRECLIRILRAPLQPPKAPSYHPAETKLSDSDADI